MVGIDFGQLANAIESPVGPKDPVTGIPQTPHKLVLNLFADVVLTGIVEHVEPTASGHALWGGLEGVELGTMTLVVNGSVVVGTVRTPDAVYTIRTAGGGAYVVRQIDESSLPPLGEPLRGSIPEPDSPPPVRPQVRGTDAPDGTSTPTSTPTPVPTVPTSPSKPAPDEAMASGLFSEVEGDPPPSPGVDTLASRLVEIDFGQLSQVTKSPVGPKDPVTGKPTEPQALVLNLFDDVVFTGIVEHVEPTASGHALWGRLDGVELGTLTLVVNGSVVVGTVRTLKAVYTIRTLADGRYVIRQIDESSLPPLGEPLEDPLLPRDSNTDATPTPLAESTSMPTPEVVTDPTPTPTLEREPATEPSPTPTPIPLELPPLPNKSWQSLDSPEDGSAKGPLAGGSRTEQPGSNKGTVYTYRDGDRTMRVVLQDNLVVQETVANTSDDVVIVRGATDSIVRRQAKHGQQPRPVFRSESGGGLMMLPGGVLLVLDAEWDRSKIDRFLLDNSISTDRIFELGYLQNGFLIQTEPGFASLELANALADQQGVVLSSPNWWREVEAK